MREIYRDPQRLYHIQEAIQDLIDSTKDLDLDTLPEKDLRYFGIVKLLEIIGEASYKLTKEFRDSHPSTPWDLMIRMRHILVHGYYQVDQSFVMNTVKDNIIPLKHQIDLYLSEFR